MGNVVNFEVKGMKELNARMVALQREIGVANVPATKWMMRGLHDGARVIRDEAIRLAPSLQPREGRNPAMDPRRQPNELKGNIVEHASREEWGTVYVRVRSRGYIFAAGPDTRRNPKSSSRKGNPNYWWLVEFGTSKMAAQPFLRPAFDGKKAAALREVFNSLQRGLDVIVAKVQNIRMAA
jgi:HK97 gp10 family phage protein